MSLPIELGSVLGGRYQVTALVLDTAEGDRVLQGQDDLLDRKVSVVIPADTHEALLVANARRIASGAGHDGFQILDLGQSDEGTYLVTSHASAANLLDSLLVETSQAEDFSLSDDIFGGARTQSSSDYVYDVLEPTQDTPVVHPGTGQSDDVPAVTRWDGDDDATFENAPAPPRVRNRLGFARKVRSEDMRTTLFDRAAGTAGGASGGATAAAAARRVDPEYDGDNRYSSFEASEGHPDRSHSRSTWDDHDPSADSLDQDELISERSEDWDGPATEETIPVVEPSPAQGVTAAQVPTPHSESQPEEHFEDRPAGATAVGNSPAAPRKGPLRFLILMLLVLALLSAVVLGFKGLGNLAGSFGGNSKTEQSQEANQPPSAAATPSSSAQSVEPVAANALRLTSDPSVMADTDATLNQAVDGNPATYWLSYGFSDQDFGSLLDFAGLAVELEKPARVNEVVIDQADGTGGNFRVYVADEPSLEGATEVGSASFTGPQITVPLADAAQETEHKYVLVVWEQLPQLANPIGGFSYGLRIGEVTPR